jgi:hypothetical protein
LVVSSEALSSVATNAGRLRAMRKIATAARVTRIMLPANTAERENTRSPRLSTGLAGAEVAVTETPKLVRSGMEGRGSVVRMLFE